MSEASKRMGASRTVWSWVLLATMGCSSCSSGASEQAVQLAVTVQWPTSMESEPVDVHLVRAEWADAEFRTRVPTVRIRTLRVIRIERTTAPFAIRLSGDELDVSEHVGLVVVSRSALGAAELSLPDIDAEAAHAQECQDVCVTLAPRAGTIDVSLEDGDTASGVGGVRVFLKFHLPNWRWLDADVGSTAYVDASGVVEELFQQTTDGAGLARFVGLPCDASTDLSDAVAVLNPSKWLFPANGEGVCANSNCSYRITLSGHRFAGAEVDLMITDEAARPIKDASASIGSGVVARTGNDGIVKLKLTGEERSRTIVCGADGYEDRCMLLGAALLDKARSPLVVPLTRLE